MVLLLSLACVSGPPGTGDGVSGDDDGVTNSGVPCEERDDDGDGSNACDDCDDDDPARFPGAVERCDGLDNDCDDALHPEEVVDGNADGVADCVPCDESGFWFETAELSGDALISALNALTADHDCVSYSEETDYLFVTLDKTPEGEVACVYTGRTTAVGSVKPDPTDMNTEHTWPQSLGADVEPAKCDLHHLFPTDADANNARGNLPFAEVTTVEDWWDETGESALGTSASGITSFEPRDAHKGNVARAMLYFAMRYGHDTSAADLSLYQAWHAADPPDAAEVARSLKIRDRQGEANPYVVCADLVDRL